MEDTKGARRGVPLAVALAVALVVQSSIGLTDPPPVCVDEETEFSPERIVDSHTTTVVADEYRPLWVSEVPAYAGLGIEDPGFRVVRGDGTVKEITRTSLKRVYSISGTSEVVLQLAIIHFPGWTAKLDGRKVPHQYSNRWGLIEVKIPKGDHELVLCFEDTGIRVVASFVSFLSVGGLVVFAAWRGWRKKRA